MIRYFRQSEWWGRASRKRVPVAFFVAAFGFGSLAWASEKGSPVPEGWGTLLLAALTGATALVGAITTLMVKMNRARTESRKLLENSRDSDEFRREQIIEREKLDLEFKKAILDRVEKLEKGQGKVEDRLKNLNKLL